MSVSKDAELEKKIKSLEELLARKDEESIAFVKEKAENKAKMEKVFEAVVQKENEIKIKEQKIIELNAFIGELSSRIETKTSEIKYLSQIIENEKALADKMARDMQKINVAKMNESSEIEQLNREKEKLTKELELAFKLLKEQKSRNKENERKLADLKESNIKLYTEEKNNLIEKITLLNEKLKENELKNAAETAKLHKLSDDMRTILWHYINSFADNCSFITTSLFERISKTEDRLKQLNLKIDSKATMLKENYKLSPFAAANFFIIQSSSHFTQIEALKQKLNEAEKKAKLKKKKRETKKEEMRLLFVEKERQLKEIILAKTKAEEKAINVIESKKRVEGFTSHLKSSLESIKVALDTVGYQVHCYYCATRDDVYVSTCGHSFCIRCVGKGAECPDCKLAADKGTINKNLLAIGKKIDLMSNLQEDIASTVKDIDKELWEK